MSDLLRDELCLAFVTRMTTSLNVVKIESNRMEKYSLQEELNNLPWLGVLLAYLHGFCPLRMDGQ